MGVSNYTLTALKVFPPTSLLNGNLELMEFMRYDTKAFRADPIIEKDDLLEIIKQKKIKLIKNPKKQFSDFTKKLDTALLIKDSEDEISEVNWKRIDEFCYLMRFSKRSNERKIRWELYHQYIQGKQVISLKDIVSNLLVFKIKNIEKLIKKILKEESKSGFDAIFDGKKITINHFIGDKIVAHYFVDALEEHSRRSRGELEESILELVDEGSYSNQEISQVLQVDETMVSKSMHKLKDKNKIVLSSFGQRGTRYFTTNCDNCPFGKTKDSCKKEALSYIINSFHDDFGIDLSIDDFADIESNQALLKMKRIIMNGKKEKTTKMEQNLGSNLDKLLGKVVENSLELNIPKKSTKIFQIRMDVNPEISKLPLLYQLGLSKGAKSGVQLIDRILKHAMSSVKKEERLRIKKHANEEVNKFLKEIGI
ncbi:MAG: hypothetical protein ACQ9CV_02035 [Nitrosopumilus sp.]